VGNRQYLGNWGMYFSIKRLTRSALLSAPALLSINQSTASADITVNGPTNSTQTPGTGENLTVTGSGSINADPGIRVASDMGFIEIQSSGQVTGDSDGISFSTVSDAIVNGFDNAGTISGVTYGIEMFGSLSPNRMAIDGGFRNSGVISGEAFGVLLARGAEINGGFVNEGTISGGIVAILESPIISGGLTNSSEIRGDDAPGILFLSESQILGGINNSGSITGDLGILMGNDTVLVGGITNSGTITATGVTTDSTLSIQMPGGDEFLTLQTGSVLNGDVGAGGGDDILNLEGMGTEDNDFLSFEQINMNGSSWSLSGDIELLTGSTLSGNVNINSGILNIDGTLIAPGGVQINGGALGGSGGIIAAISVGSGGAISPGNSIGTLSVGGDLSFGAGSFFDVELEGQTADFLQVFGDVTIDPAATLRLIPLGDGIDVVDQTILEAVDDVTNVVSAVVVVTDRTIDANFQNIEADGLAAITELVDGDRIVLTAVSQAPTEIGALAGIQDSLAFQEILPGSVGATNTVLVGPETQLWGKGIYEFNERDDTTDFAGFDQETKGVVFGLDQSLTSSFRLGGAVGYTDSDVDINTRMGDADVQSFHAGLYGLFEKNAFYLDMSAQIGRQDKELTRPVIVSGVTTNVTGETHALSYGAHAKGGWSFDLNEVWTSRLNLNAAYIRQSQNDYTDSSGVKFGGLDTDMIRLGPSIDLAVNLQKGETLFRPRASIGYLQQWTGGDDMVDVTFSSGTVTTAPVEDRDDDFAIFGVGLDALFGNGVSAFVDYDGEYGDEETRNRITAGLRFGL